MASESGSVVGGLESLFLIFVYGFVLYRGTRIVNGARQRLLEIFTPGIASAAFLTLMSSIPTAIVVLASGIRGSKSTAESQILIGLGSLAGSTILLLTLLWGSCILVGRNNGQAVKTDDVETSHTARIMLISSIPFIMMLAPLVLPGTAEVRIVTLVSLIISVLLLISYLLYLVFTPWIQKRRVDLSDMRGLGKLVNASGEPNTEALHKLFRVLDRNSDGLLSASELRALLIGVQFEEIDLGINEALKKHIKDFGKSGEDVGMDIDEFVSTMSKWLRFSRHSIKLTGLGIRAAIRFKHLPLQRQQYSSLLKEKGEPAGSGSQSSHPVQKLLQSNNDETAPGIEYPKSVLYGSIAKLLCGIAIAAASSYPLVDVINNFSSDSGIPMFFVSFITIPFACYSWVGSDVLTARRKKARMVSLTFSEIYEAVTVNNIFCTALFLVLVYVRDLTLEFSSDALAALIVTVAVGLLAGFRTVFPLWIGIVACALYPFSLAVVCVLQYVVGLS